MSKPTDGGFFLVARRVFDHRAFHEPYNDISAWLNLIARAEWEPRIVNRLGRTIRLQRGQLADSHRFLAERWGWEHKRVERFFDRLLKHRMIRKHIEAGIGIITIVNYRLYQDGGGQHPQDVASKSNRSALLPGQCRGKNRGSERGSEYPKNGAVNFAKSANAAGISKIGEDESGAVNRAVTGAVNGAVLFKNRGKENQLSKESKTRSKNPSRLPPGEVTLRATVREIRIAFEDWWEAYPRKVARKRATEVYTAAIKAGEATIAELLTGVKAYAAECAGKEARFIAYPTTWLRDGRWADEAASATAKPKGYPDDYWRECLAKLKSTGKWLNVALGPRPGEAGCRVPSHLLAEFNMA